MNFKNKVYEVGSRKSEVGSRKSEVGSRNLKKLKDIPSN